MGIASRARRMVQYSRRSIPEEAMASAYSRAREVRCSRRFPVCRLYISLQPQCFLASNAFDSLFVYNLQYPSISEYLGQ